MSQVCRCISQQEQEQKGFRLIRSDSLAREMDLTLVSHKMEPRIEFRFTFIAFKSCDSYFRDLMTSISFVEPNRAHLTACARAIEDKS
jgi:hypothetical protein